MKEEEENYVSCTNNMTNSTAIVMEEDEEQDNYERMIKIYVLGAMFIMTLFGNGLILVGVKKKNVAFFILVQQNVNKQLMKCQQICLHFFKMLMKLSILS